MILRSKVGSYPQQIDIGYRLWGYPPTFHIVPVYIVQQHLLSVSFS